MFFLGFLFGCHVPQGLLLLDRWESVINKRKGRVDISSRGPLAVTQGISGFFVFFFDGFCSLKTIE